jgi:hypothetical protein
MHKERLCCCCPGRTNYDYHDEYHALDTECTPCGHARADVTEATPKGTTDAANPKLERR